MSRTKLAGLLIGAVVAAAAAGFAVASQIQSPAQIAANTAAPEASAILVPAEERILSTDVVTRGTARFGSPLQVTLAPSALKPQAGRITNLPLAGTELFDGDVLLIASGRPVFVIEGHEPVFRDLGPGLEGPDVMQLEEALVRLGFDPGPVDGLYDGATEAAVASWYQSSGFTAVTATGEQLEAIRALEGELTAAGLDTIGARNEVSAAEKELAAAWTAVILAQAEVDAWPGRIEAAERLANAENDAAQAEVDARQAALDRVKQGAVPAPAAEIETAEAELDAAKKNEELTRVAGANTVAEAKRNPELSYTALSGIQAEARLANEAAAAETAVRQKALDGLLAGTLPAAGEVEAAEAELRQAVAARETTRLTGIETVEGARTQALVAGGELADAKAALGNAHSTANRAGDALRVRQEIAGLSADNLGGAQRRAGVQVPADEIVFVPNAPVRVSTLVAGRGDEAAGQVATVTDSVVAVDGALPLNASTLVEPGMVVAIDEPDLGIKGSGVVTRVADGPGTDGVDGFHVYFEVLVDESPAAIVGASVRLTVPVESSGDAVLVVPIAALSLAADGSSRVQRDAAGVLEFVTVEPGLSAEGYVEVRTAGGALASGDMVVVGFDQVGAES